MPTYSFRCAGGHAFDKLLAISRRDEPVECECGRAAERVFALNSNILASPLKLHTSFADIAPRDEDGRPMTVIEAARSGKYQRYNRTEEYRVGVEHKRKIARKHDGAMAAAVKEAWSEQKVSIRSSEL